MDYLCDTNLMWRCFSDQSPDHRAIKYKIDTPLNAGNDICITPQNLIEYHGVATRSVEANGLGMNVFEADRKAIQMKEHFSLPADTADIYVHWHKLILEYNVQSRQVHDARLVAVMLTYGITHILTRNAADFRRYQEITVVEI